MLGDVTAATFRPHVGGGYTLWTEGDGSVPFELLDVSEAVGAWTPSNRTPFTLQFRAATADVLPQRIYRIEHEDLGEFALFLVPTGRDAAGILYEAVFS